MLNTLIKFGTVGGLGVLWKSLLLIFMVEYIHINPELAIFPIAFIILIHNYELNRIWTFKAKRTIKNFSQYAVTNAASLGVYFGLFFLFNTFMFYLFASWLAVIFAAGINFVLANWIFNNVTRSRTYDESQIL